MHLACKRPEGAEHRGWEWSRIRQRSKDILALQQEDGTCLAIWSSGRKVLKLDSGTYYRLDYLEVNPDRRGEGWGAVAVAAACARARELGADQIVLGALPQAIPYWRKIAVQGAPEGWNCAKELEPYVIGSDVVGNLERVFHAQFITK